LLDFRSFAYEKYESRLFMVVNLKVYQMTKKYQKKYILERNLRNMDNDCNFAKKIAALRKMSGMQQKELAEKLGVSKNRISDYENNRAFPTLQVMVKLSDVFNVPVDYFYSKYMLKSPLFSLESEESRIEEIPVLSNENNEFRPIPDYMYDSAEKYFYYDYNNTPMVFEYFSDADYCDNVLAKSNDVDEFRMYKAEYNENNEIVFVCDGKSYNKNELKILGVLYIQIPYRKFILEEGENNGYGRI